MPDAALKGMLTKLAAFLFVALGATALAEPAPDFLGHSPARHIPADLAASDGRDPIAPGDVVAFKLDSAVLLSSSIGQLDRAAHWLKHHPGYRMVVQGHCDLIGDRAYNTDLATRRAQIVKNHFMSWGIASDRIVLVIFGKDDAIVPDNPSDRRVVMYATTDSPDVIAADHLANTRAEAIVWTDKNQLIVQRAETGIATRK